ncbi:ubiquinol-cytochrome c reductase iron-sulfur subunit [Roseomonas sp. NAR14]|uniref:Ubiquinol-cytochrome c reductase iron-sulfur subunit n=1 Tax=Roseomonas acroporae TaxID=2937791 RepID=A0A9X2BY10_9PROT|nr:ubiquinol-cytochrome c reductase iron-sulfur subunit [Roseomonas acroporae]MCK8785520.1 ubiquinol-cytochrome c reductase iron-sulfur subunit [Roseomonas acroporae]
MAETLAAPPGSPPHGREPLETPLGTPPESLVSVSGTGTRRDMLTLMTASFVAVGVGAMVWPFIDQMNPASDVLALASTDVNLAPVAVGQAITVVWRGKPIFVRHRTPKEIEEARGVSLSALKDPQTDAQRVQKPEWIVMIGICTHLGCVPLGQKPTDPKGDYDGWFCPCHGSMYDSSGRIRQGPAPSNLVIPPYAFTSDTQIRIG